MAELLPIASGLLLGAIIGTLRPSLRLAVGVPVAIVLGILATVISGEFKTSWGYLLIDIPLVAVAAVVGMLVARHVRQGAQAEGA